MLMGVRTSLGNAFGLLGTVSLGAAAGAGWMVATLYLRQPTAWLALPVGAVLAWVLRTGIHAPGVACAALAALATLVAALSLNVLLVGVQIAGSMGLNLTDALRTAGAGLLWQLTRMATSPTDIAWYAIGAAFAAAIALRRTRR